MTETTFHSSTAQKFVINGIHTPLNVKLAPHIEPINYDRWSELHWKAQLEDNLTAPESQELAEFVGANMQTIMDVYDALQSDADVGEWMLSCLAGCGCWGKYNYNVILLTTN